MAEYDLGLRVAFAERANAVERYLRPFGGFGRCAARTDPVLESPTHVASVPGQQNGTLLPVDEVANVSGGVSGGGDRPKRPVLVEIDCSAERLEDHRVGEVFVHRWDGLLERRRN